MELIAKLPNESPIASNILILQSIHITDPNLNVPGPQKIKSEVLNMVLL